MSLYKKYKGTDNKIFSLNTNINILTNSMIAYTFNQHIDIVFDSIKNIATLSQVLTKFSPYFTSEPISITNLIFYEIGNVFLIEYNHQLSLYFKLIELVDTDYYCKIRWLISKTKKIVKEEQIGFFSINLHRSFNNKTFLISRLEGFVPIEIKSKKEGKIFKEINLFFSYFEKKINSRVKHYQYISSKIIHVEYEFSKNLFININLYKQIFGKNISFNSDIINKGTIINIKHNKDKSIFQVREFKQRLKYLNIIFNIYYKSKDNFPTIILSFEIFDVNKSDTFFLIKVPFINSNNIKELINFKNNFLKKILYVIEKNYYENLISKINILDKNV